MVSQVLLDIGSSFVLGLLTPLTAACVIPLYPGFLAYLSRQFRGDESRETYVLFGLIVVAGVLSFMLLLGLIFTTLLEKSLTTVIGIASPIAFGILGLISMFLILDLDAERVLPSFSTPESDNPMLNGYGFGFFFGAIVIPCNPGFIAAFFAKTLLIQTPVSNLLNFTAFGLGIGFPLIAFSLISAGWRQNIISWLTSNKTMINRTAGAVMLAVSLYYLVFVFDLAAPIL